ncbi:VOC family protein [Sagittula sp. NFXS13]|uniref:VOC family protein n=1 Tax=Sagittula sp. NFXS13 TaxID=2819095 RepID=UPI0032DEDC59
MKVHPYLTFDGTTVEAMTFYQTALGGELTIMMYSDMPPGDDIPEGAGGKVAHARLDLGNIMLQASDRLDGSGAGFKGFDLQIDLSDVEKGRALFDALAEGGDILMPYGDVFWARAFGTLRDKFGVPWMIHVA